MNNSAAIYSALEEGLLLKVLWLHPPTAHGSVLIGGSGSKELSTSRNKESLCNAMGPFSPIFQERHGIVFNLNF